MAWWFAARGDQSDKREEFMPLIEEKVIINAPVAKVFAFVINPRNWTEARTSRAWLTFPTFLHRHWSREPPSNGNTGCWGSS